MLSSSRIGLTVALTGMLLSGCGSNSSAPEGVIVQGTVVQNGSPLVVPRRDVGLGSVEIRFVPVTPTDGSGNLVLETETGFVEEDGTFELRAGGRGMKPGSYKVAIFQQDRGPGSDVLQGAFSEKNTPIEIVVPEDKLGDTFDLGVIELSKYTSQ